MDKECVALCEELNKLPGVETTESCCGHGKHPYMIFFGVLGLSDLPIIAYCAHSCHSGASGWDVIAKTDCSMMPISFLLQGPVGDYEGAALIAQTLHEENI